MNKPLNSGDRQLASALQAVHGDIFTAIGMPNAAYTDEAYFRFERDHVISPNWAALTFAHSLQNNCIEPIDFMGLPLLVTKDGAGRVRVFHNVCSHRGMQLVAEKRPTNGRIVCPYHSWTYTIAGDLEATPNIGGTDVHSVAGFTCAGRGLKEIRSAVWLGIVMVNLSGDAEPFAEYAGSEIHRAGALMGAGAESLLRIPDRGAELTYTLKCNWKFVVENFLEAYHLPFVHPGLNAYSPLSEHDCVIHGENSAGQVCTAFNPAPGAGKPLPQFPNWDASKTAVGDYPALYPNLLLGYQVNHIFAIIITPLDAGNTLEKAAIFYVGDTALGEDSQPMRDENLATWDGVFREDIEPCERMQAGRQSPGFSGGGFSPVLDVCSHHFHRWIAQQYARVHCPEMIAHPPAAPGC